MADEIEQQQRDQEARAQAEERTRADAQEREGADAPRLQELQEQQRGQFAELEREQGARALQEAPNQDERSGSRYGHGEVPAGAEPETEDPLTSQMRGFVAQEQRAELGLERREIDNSREPGQPGGAEARDLEGAPNLDELLRTETQRVEQMREAAEAVEQHPAASPGVEAARESVERYQEHDQLREELQGGVSPERAQEIAQRQQELGGDVYSSHADAQRSAGQLNPAERQEFAAAYPEQHQAAEQLQQHTQTQAQEHTRAAAQSMSYGR